MSNFRQYIQYICGNGGRSANIRHFASSTNILNLRYCYSTYDRRAAKACIIIIIFIICAA